MNLANYTYGGEMGKRRRDMNSGYSGFRQSKRAEKAVANGEYPLSMLTNKRLEKCGIDHSINFIAWLVKEGHITHTSRHHRGNPPTLTKFYHPKHIRRQLDVLDEQSLLNEWRDVWLGRKGKKAKKQGV